MTATPRPTPAGLLFFPTSKPGTFEAVLVEGPRPVDTIHKIQTDRGGVEGLCYLPLNSIDDDTALGEFVRGTGALLVKEAADRALVAGAQAHADRASKSAAEILVQTEREACAAILRRYAAQFAEHTGRRYEIDGLADRILARGTRAEARAASTSDRIERAKFGGPVVPGCENCAGHGEVETGEGSTERCARCGGLG